MNMNFFGKVPYARYFLWSGLNCKKYHTYGTFSANVQGGSIGTEHDFFWKSTVRPVFFVEWVEL